ncbi:hypothetical protein B0O99DRAFT_574078 [Bisporella sp. PMI_857]|nr:hypothetical protein B0O99DRAFT_574078 [Bisporella sp. PMI_857]
MSSAGNFQQVLANFTKRLSKDELSDFKFSSLQDVLATVEIIQAEQGQKKKMMNLTRIQRFLEAMNNYGKVIEVFLNASDILCFVWGPMNTWADSFDTLLGAYQQLSESIPLFDQYHSLFETNPDMERVLIFIYDDILEFHRAALRFFKRPMWKQLFRSAWNDFRTRFQHILDDLCRHKALIETQANLARIQESRNERAHVRNQFDMIEDDRRRRRHLDVINWLSAVDPRLDQEAARAIWQEYPASGQWLLVNEKMKAWMDSNSSLIPMLWMNGIPGAGKTILTSLIVHECQISSMIPVLYFYCNHQDAHRKSFQALSRAFLVQLLRYDEALLPYIYDKCIGSGNTSLVSSQMCDEILRTCLKTMSEAYIIIDGIDECDPTERKTILSFFISIIERANAAAKLRALFVSQDENDIRKSLRTASVLKLTDAHNRSDIESYTSHWVSKIQAKFSLPQKTAEYIKSAVCEGSDGAISMNTKDHTVDFENRRLCQHVSDLCGSLVEVLPGDRVRLVHGTAKSYLIHHDLVHMHQEERELALLCLRYMLFDCFDANLLEDEVRELIGSGYYAFQDYAVVHWVDHLEDSIPYLLQSDTQIMEDINSAISDFHEAFGAAEASEDDISQELRDKCKHLEKVPFHENLLLLLGHTRKIRKQEESIAGLGEFGDIISRNRSILERLISLDPASKANLQTIYGEHWHKCPRHACFFFHEGFPNSARRDNHVSRHEKPFFCTETSCPRIHLGFSTEKELKRHMNINHPDPSILFPKIKKPPKKHVCETCSTEFTRAHNLKVHRLTHTNERPWACSLCDKTFVRKHDRDRHERLLHSTSASGSPTPTVQSSGDMAV